MYAGNFTGLLLYRLGWGVLFTQCAVAPCFRQRKANIHFNLSACLVDEFSSWWPDRRILRRSEICKYFNARKYLRRIIEASDCRPIARTRTFEIMPQIHFWFLHYSLLNILTRLPENYIEHQEFFVNSDFFAKICNIFYKSNSFY